MVEAGWSHADGVFLDSHSAVSGGRGGTNLGFSDNGAILHENPAALVRIDDVNLFDINVSLLFNDLKFSNPGGESEGRYRSPENPGTLGQVAYIRRLPDSRFAVGLGVYVPAGYGTNLRRTSAFAGDQTYRSFNAVGRVLPSVGYRVNDRLSLGASVGVAIGYLELEGPYVLQSAPLTGLPTIIDLDGLDVSPTATVGAQYLVGERTVLGAAYTAPIRFNLNGDAAVTIPQPQGLPPVVSGFDADVTIEYPQSVGIGLSHGLTQRHRIAADIIWYDWSSAFDNIKLRFSGPDNPALAGVTVEETAPLDWKDSLSLRLGFEYDVTARDTVRLGYVHHSSASPDETLISYIPAVLENAFTVGFSHDFGGFRFNGSYMYQRGSQSVETSRYVGGDFSNSRIDSEYHVFSAGIRVSY